MSEHEQILNKDYLKLRQIREGKSDIQELASLYQSHSKNFADDWLFMLETLEIIKSKGIQSELAKSIEKDLLDLAKKDEKKGEVIRDGLALSHTLVI